MKVALRMALWEQWLPDQESLCHVDLARKEGLTLERGQPVQQALALLV